MELKVIGVNKRNTRKAYEDKEGNQYVDCNQCESVKLVSDFPRNSNQNAFMQVDTRCKVCKRGYIKKKKYSYPNYYENNKEKYKERYERNRDEILAKKREYRKENREEVLEYHRQYRKENKDKLNASKRIYYTNNREYIIERAKDYYQNNRERVNKYSKKYYKENRGRLLDYHKEYRENNPEVFRQWREDNKERYKTLLLNRRTREKELPSTLTEEELEVIIHTYEGCCCLTGLKGDIHLDHIIPVAVGHGGTTYENMIPLNATLNMSKNASNIFEWAENNYERLGFPLDRFNLVMAEVADRNNMTFEEYKEYVYWCFDNKRELATA